VVLDVPGDDVAVVELGGEARAERNAAVARAADAEDGVRGGGSAHVLGVGEVLAQEARALGGGLGMGHDALDLRERQLLAREHAVVDRVDHLRLDAHPVGLDGQGVEGHRDAALERVLDRHEGALHVAFLHGHDSVVDRGIRGGLGARGRRRAQGLVAVRPRGT
jgi:hypothetical protein